MSTSENIGQLIRITAIHDQFVDESTSLDDQAKALMKRLSHYTRDFLVANPKLNGRQVEILKNELLGYWNERIVPETEDFWAAVRSNGITIERKEPLRFALAKKRFPHVEQGIDARNNWAALKKLSSVTSAYSKAEIEQIDGIIADDEQKRHAVLNKCLRKKAIAQSLYLKFGECMAYFARCGLWDKYFTTVEVKELFNIWQNFRSN